MTFMTKDEEKKLSQQQMKYVRERLMQIRDVKMKEVEDEYDDPPSSDDLMKQEIGAGRVRLIPEKLPHAGPRTDLCDVLYFKKYRGTTDEVHDEVLAVRQSLREEISNRKNLVREEMAKILDQAMLGDAVQALSLLEEFSGKKF